MAQLDLVGVKKKFRRGYKRFAKQPPLQLLGVNFLQILALWGIAVVQPLLGVMGNNTETFLRYGIEGSAVLWAVVVFALVPPMFAIVAEAVAIRWRKLAYGAHLTILFGLMFVFALQVAKFYVHLDGPLQAMLAIFFTCALIAFLVVNKSAGAWLRLLAVVPVIAVMTFVFNTPAGRYARGVTVDAYNVETGTTPIVMVMFDEFPVAALMNRDGTIDADRFPNFARLASTSTWYRNFTTTSETTNYAVPSVLSGNLPDDPNKSFTYVDHPDNLFTWLGGSYKMNVSEFLSQMCSPSICDDANLLAGAKASKKESQWRSFVSDLKDVFKQRIDLTKKNEYDAVNAAAAQTDAVSVPSTTVVPNGSDSPSTSVAKAKPHNIPFLAQIQPSRFRSWLKAIPDDPTGTLNFIHLLLPHQSWIFWGDGTSYRLTGGEQFVGESAWETKVRQQRMILQTQFVDQLLGTLLDKLESNDAYKDALVIVQADHGVSLDAGFSHRFISLDYSNAPDIAYPPLFIHAPGQTQGVVSDENVENIDEMSIMSKLLDTKVPWKMDGMLPEDKSGDRAATKTMWLNPEPYDIAPRPERTLTFNATNFQKSLFARIPHGATTAKYLDMLYADTPNYSLMGKLTETGELPPCECNLAVDNDLRSDTNPLMYIRGVAHGDLKVGDWVAFIVHGKISGLSQIFKRDGKKMYATLVYREDYGDDWSDPQAAKIGADGALTELIPLK